MYQCCCLFWLTCYNQYTLPPTVQQAASYVAYLSLLGRAPGTIATYISAISYKHKTALQQDPTSNFLVKKLIEGTMHATGRRIDSQRPLTYELLMKLLNALPFICNNRYESALFQAAFSTAYFAFLRVGEFTAPSKWSETSQILQRGDVTFGHNVVNTTI